MEEDYIESLEERLRALQNMMGQGTGIGSTPQTDPTYSSGFEYARSIAGGMPFEDVVQEGMMFSPEYPMGITQSELDELNRFRSEGPVPVMPDAPSKGEELVMEDQMPFAPAGTPEPTIFGQTPPQDFKPDFDFLRDLISGKSPVMGIEPTAQDLELLKQEERDLERESELAQLESLARTGAGREVPVMQAPVMPQAPGTVPSQFIPSIPGMPTPLPMPITQPTPPVQPMPMPVFTPPPVPSLLSMPQVRTEEIVSPIVTGSRRFVPPSLINLV